MRTLARSLAKPARAATVCVKMVKLPDTSTVWAPLAFIVSTSVRAPKLSVMRSCSTCSKSAALKPLSRPMRSRKPASKSSSPSIERSVIAAISGLMPRSSAISSRLSWPMMVESMSAMSMRFLRPAVRCTHQSRGRPATAAATISLRWESSPSLLSLSRQGRGGRLTVRTPRLPAQRIVALTPSPPGERIVAPTPSPHGKRVGVRGSSPRQAGSNPSPRPGPASGIPAPRSIRVAAPPPYRAANLPAKGRR